MHGDYRIDNTILDADDPTRVRAVVDWELSTLGDPLSDAALMCVYRDPALDLIVNAQAAWTSPLLPTADELADRYSLVSGVPLGHWEFYMALAYFKLAIIAAGIDFRRRMSEKAQGKEDTSDGPEVVAPLISRGLAELTKLGISLFVASSLRLRLRSCARGPSKRDPRALTADSAQARDVNRRLFVRSHGVLLGRSPQLKDSRRAYRDGKQPATHCREQDGHPFRQAPLPAEEEERRGFDVLSDEDQQQDQHQETRDQRRP